MEGIQESSVEKRVESAQEVGLEMLKHLDVSEMMKEKNAFFVHTIEMRKDFDVSENNKSVDTAKLSAPDKLDILYSTNPTVSASTLRPDTKDSLFHGGFGVIFSHGEIEHAGTNDQGTVATSLKERQVIGGAAKEKEDIDRAIDRPQEDGGYNEIVLKNPEVAGGFMRLGSLQARTTYMNEEHEYYNGEKTITKIGVIDFSTPLDRFGRPTLGNYDLPFSMLLEMKKRGKVFILDDRNRMHIVQHIDEVNRKVEFVSSPIDPKTFSQSYGEDRINIYAKKEMKERLEASLKVKGIELQ